MAKSAITALAFAGFLIAGTRAQATHTVMVGDRGSFYDPPTVSALDNDVVEFVFVAGIHGVTQSTPDSPCVQVEGGFNSGLIQGPGINATASYPSWYLTIQNASESVFYFCQATVPVSHCANGMVGAINAPADVYENFTSLAKAVSGTPAPTTSVVLTGVGAFATASPLIPPPPTTSTTSTTSSIPPQTSTATPSPSPKSSSNTGAIVGGAVGGAAIVVISGLIALLWLREKNRRAAVAYHGTGMTQDSKGFIAPQGTGGSSGGFPHSTGLTSSPLVPSVPFQQSGGILGLGRDTAQSSPYTREVGFGQTLPALAASNERRDREAAAASSADIVERERHGEPGPIHSFPSGAFSSTSQDPETARVSQYSDAFISAVQQAALSQHQQSATPSGLGGGQGQSQGQGGTVLSPGVNVHELAKEVAALLAPALGSNTNTEVQSDYTGQSSQVPGDRSGGLGAPGLRANEPSYRKGPPRYDEHQ